MTSEGARGRKWRVGPRSQGARPAGLQVAREAGGEWCRLRAARKMAVARAWSGWPARWRRRATLHSLAEPLSCLTGCCHCCWHEGSLLLLLLPHTTVVTPLPRHSSTSISSPLLCLQENVNHLFFSTCPLFRLLTFPLLMKVFCPSFFMT